MINTMSNETGAKSLGELIEGEEFRIPMYQRNYKWNTDVAKKLVEDIVNSYDDDDTKSKSKSIGLITLYKKDDGIYDVIDGQQRFTTLAILLGILGSDKIKLHFERDCGDKKRENAISGKNASSPPCCTDVDRINRNRDAMQNVLNKYENKIPKEKLTDHILKNVKMLRSVVKILPVEEFMNLNAYKTAFSISDHIRANLIALNSFYKEELEKKDTEVILARCLSNHSYKTAVAVLYNNILDKLYNVKKKKENKNDKYESIYDLLKKYSVDPDKSKESRINIIFSSMLKKGAENYYSGEITKNLGEWINILQKLAFLNKLLDEMKEEFERGEFHSFKQIDDYQTITRKSFINEVFDGIDEDENLESQTLATEIQKYSNVDSVIIMHLEDNMKKLANRYLEAFVHSEVNSETDSRADDSTSDTVKLPQMKTDEVMEDISGCGSFIIHRYEIEHREDLKVYVDIPPVLDLEDRENINFGGSLKLLELVNKDEIMVGKLFNHNIKIPVIQRDYCMGARITGENDFLSFLLDGYDNNNKLSASTVLLSVSEDEDSIYIFDGQQRTFTLYNILKYCGVDLPKYSFVGREVDESNKEYSSPYSKEAVENLNETLKTLKKKIITEEDKKIC